MRTRPTNPRLWLGRPGRLSLDRLGNSPDRAVYIRSGLWIAPTGTPENAVTIEARFTSLLGANLLFRGVAAVMASVVSVTTHEPLATLLGMTTQTPPLLIPGAALPAPTLDRVDGTGNDVLGHAPLSDRNRSELGSAEP